MCICVYKCTFSLAGKKTKVTVTHTKKLTMNAKLSEKNLKQMEDKGKCDEMLGMPLPTSVACSSNEDSVKMELPSLEPLQKSHKVGKTAYLFNLTNSSGGRMSAPGNKVLRPRRVPAS